MNTVKVAQGAVAVSSDNRDHRVLRTVTIFASEIVLESVFGRTQETQFVPTATPTERSQRRHIGSSNNGHIHVLSEMLSDAVEGIDPRSTHPTGRDLLLSKHEVIDHE